MSLLLDDPQVGPLVPEFENPDELETIADLLHKLGDIPSKRVQLKPAPGTATEENLTTFIARTGHLAELVESTLVEKPMGAPESRLAFQLGFYVEQFLEENNLGITYGPDATLKILPETIRLPDFSFVAWNRIAIKAELKKQVPNLVPNFAVEILSPSNTKGEMARKRREYFSAGTRIVWEVEPETRIVRVYSDADTFTTVDEQGTLSGGDVLPGFTLSVKKWFDRAFRDGV